MTATCSVAQSTWQLLAPHCNKTLHSNSSTGSFSEQIQGTDALTSMAIRDILAASASTQKIALPNLKFSDHISCISDH